MNATNDNPIVKIEEVSFLDFLGGEEQNLLTSLHAAGRRVIDQESKPIQPIFDAFYTLDQLYKEALKNLTVGIGEDIIGSLFLFVHYHFYFSITCHFRTHNAEGLASTRKAIDASLSAYMMISDASSIEKYKSRDPIFQHIKNTMANHRKTDPSKFALAITLIRLHEYCSHYGSHADIDGFMGRIRKKGDQMLVLYFEEPKSIREFQLDITNTLIGYLDMFQIFREFLELRIPGLKQSWQERIPKFQTAIQETKTRLTQGSDAVI